MNEQGLYKEDIKVGYAGDYAAVTLDLVVPRVTKSVRHEKHRDVSCDVIATSDTFNRKSLIDAISKTNDVPTRIVLAEALDELVAFIERNGETNPASAVDWEPA